MRKVSGELHSCMCVMVVFISEMHFYMIVL